MEDLKPIYKTVNEEMGYENPLFFEKNGVINIHLPPNPGRITGPIFQLSLSARNRSARLYIRQIRSRECIVRYEKSLNLYPNYILDLGIGSNWKELFKFLTELHSSCYTLN